MKQFLSFFLILSEESLGYLQEKKTDLFISSIILILANLVSIAGILWLNWDAVFIIFLFWLENIIIGFLNIFKILIVGFTHGFFSELKSIYQSISFTLHYSLFSILNLIFFLLIFYSKLMSDNHNFSFNVLLHKLIGNYTFHSFSEILNSNLLSFFLLLISHTVSFIIFFIKDKEYKTIDKKTLITAPYKRVILLQAVLIGGSFLIFRYQDGATKLFIMLIGLKIILDLRAHIKDKIT